MESYSLGSYGQTSPFSSPFFASPMGSQSATTQAPQTPVVQEFQKTQGSGTSMVWVWILVGLLIFIILALLFWWWSKSSSCTTTVIDSPQIPVSSGISNYVAATGSLKPLSTTPAPSNSDRTDPLSNPNNGEALPSIWIGEVGTENNLLSTPEYGYFFPRKIDEVEVRPSVNAATLVGPVLYIHLNTKGLEGIYRVDTTLDTNKWELWAATGTNKEEAPLKLSQLDSSEDSSVTDLYTLEGQLHLVTAEGCYKLTDQGLAKVQSGIGLLGADANSNGTISLSDDGMLSLNQAKIKTEGGLRVRTDVPSFIKYIHRDEGVYAVTTTDANGRVGYTTGRDSQLRPPIEGNIRAFGAVDGYFCCVDHHGRVMINEYDNQHLVFKYPSGIPYGVTVPVGPEFELTVTVGNGRAFIFSCYSEQRVSTPEAHKPCCRKKHRNSQHNFHSSSSSSSHSSSSSSSPNSSDSSDEWRVARPGPRQRGQIAEVSGMSEWDSN